MAGWGVTIYFFYKLFLNKIIKLNLKKIIKLYIIMENSGL